MKQDNNRKSRFICNEAASTQPRVWQILNKVPEVTILFWIIKIMATTVGETAADFLNTNLNLGLTVTTFVMGGLLFITLFSHFSSKKYVPRIYCLAVVFRELLLDSSLLLIPNCPLFLTQIGTVSEFS
ncbi:MAG: hypothetical protein P4L69_15720 [Desulfosporosinus sp.]|nr:hypothetical protein [Desulfosporosinus sp.]